MDLSQEMYGAIAQLKTPEDCEKFFAKLWNPSELRAMEQRVDLALFLKQNGTQYLEVLERSGNDELAQTLRAAMLEHGTGGIIEELIDRPAGKEE